MIDLFEDSKSVEGVPIDSHHVVELQNLKAGDEYANTAVRVQHDPADAVLEEEAQKRTHGADEQLVVERQN